MASHALALVLPLLGASPPARGSPPIQVPSKPHSERVPRASPLLVGELPLHCPTTAQTERAIGHYLGRPLADDDPHTAVQIAETHGGYRLELHTHAGSHVLEGVDCGRLVELAASVAAVAIDPLAGLLPPPPSGVTTRLALAPIAVPSHSVPSDEATVSDEPPRDEAPPSEPPLRPELQPRTTEPREQDLEADRGETDRSRSPAGLRGLASASSSLGFGLFPGPSPGFEVGLGLARRAASRRVGVHVELVGGADFAGRFRASGGEVGGNLLAGHAALRACAAPAWRRIELRACGRAGAGVLQARGVGVVSPDVVRQPWIFVGAELGLALALHRNAALVLDVGAGANLLRPHVWTSDPAADYVMPALSGRGRLGLEVRFP